VVEQRAGNKFTRCREASSHCNLLFRAIGCLLLSGLFAAASLAAQQGQPSWSGAVRNPAGQPVAGATVSFFAAETEKHTAVSGPDGRFSLAGLLPGAYTLTVQLPGQPATAPLAISISSGTPITLRK